MKSGPWHRPLIGICGATANATWTFWSQPAVLVARTYLDAVGETGGVPDGAIEAVEWPDQTFALGVQWHPEDPGSGAIFEEFIRAAATKSQAALTMTANEPGEP